MKGIVIILSLMSLMIWGILRIANAIDFNRNCEGHLKRAADANTIELAKQEMTIAIKYAEFNNLTNGYTSVIYTTPNEDVGFWYQNLKQSLMELESVTNNSSQLEKSNILMKLRETLLDEGEKASVTVPKGISIFPNNVLYCWWSLISFIFLLVFSFWFLFDEDWF